MAVITVFDPFESEFYGDAGWTGAEHPTWWDTQANMPPGDGVDASAEVTNTTSYTVTANVPMATTNWGAYSIEGEGFSAPFYGDPIFTPSLIDFGTIIDEKVVTFTIYNASILPKIISVADLTPVAGITLSSATAMPFVIGSLATVTMEVTAAMLGPSSISGGFTFYIGGDEFYLPFIGIRSLAFPFAISGRGPAVEKISYMTSVSTCLDGTETRYGLCTDPRVTLEAEYTCFEMDAVRLREIISSWMAKTFDVYQWQEETRLLAPALAGTNVLSVPTADMPWMVGSTIVLFQDTSNYEVVTIAAIGTDELLLQANLTGNWNVFATVIPRLTMRLLTDINLMELSPYIYTFNAVWESDPAARGVWVPEASPAVTYKGLEVFQFQHNWRDNRNTYIRQNSGFLNQGYGAISLSYQSPSAPIGFDFMLFAENRNQLRKIREFIHRRKGRLRSFYLPSEREDLKLTRGLGIGEAYLYVEYRPEIPMVFDQANHRNVVITRTNGVKIYLTIIAYTILETNEVRFQVEENFAESVNLVQMKSISYMYLARLDSDSVSISRHTADVAEVTIPCVALKEIS